MSILQHLLPVPSGIARICGMWHEGTPLPDIAEAMGLPIEDVMAVLNLDWRCSDCGLGADLSQGVSASYCTGGDQSAEFWGTGCCGGWHLDRQGNEYLGGSPWRDEAF